MNITIIAGARPNFMKIAPILHAIERDAKQVMQYRLVHTGQHYDKQMSDTFFNELNIPEPHINLEAGGGTQAEQTAAVMIAFEKELLQNPADLVIVVGDVTSTLACSIVAKKLNTKVAHVEAGIRSFDLTMPEEINRMVTDSITDYFFTTSEWAGDNLRKNGVTDGRIFFVGNVMIDTLLANRTRFQPPAFFEERNFKRNKYLLLTLHRPANVDQATNLSRLIKEICLHAGGLPVIFPIHPRTARVFREAGIDYPNLYIADPLGYLEFNWLAANAKAVITDSGGITEETTVMGVPCLTLRNNTERPETVSVGTNELIGTDPSNIAPALQKIFKGEWKQGGIPEKWDGRAAERIVNLLMEMNG